MGEEKNAQSIFLARKLPDAKPIPGLDDVFLEKQSASLSIKLVRHQFFIEVSLDQATMEQKILSIAGWLVGKLSVSGSTSADALRDAVVSAMTTLRFTDSSSLSVSYLGTRSVNDADVMSTYNAVGTLRDLLALNAGYSGRLGRTVTLATNLQAAVSSTAEDGSPRDTGNGVEGNAQLTTPRLLFRLASRKYSENYAGLGLARQTEFCRTPNGLCTTQ